MKKYNKFNCDSRLRAVITDKWGRTISLFGTHAFSYDIVIESCGKITIHNYPNGKEARKAFQEYKKKKI